jgi:hypothetical protein
MVRKQFFCWVPIPQLTTVVSLVALFYYMPTNNQVNWW